MKTRRAFSFWVPWYIYLYQQQQKNFTNNIYFGQKHKNSVYFSWKTEAHPTSDTSLGSENHHSRSWSCSFLRLAVSRKEQDFILHSGGALQALIRIHLQQTSVVAWAAHSRWQRERASWDGQGKEPHGTGCWLAAQLSSQGFLPSQSQACWGTSQLCCATDNLQSNTRRVLTAARLTAAHLSRPLVSTEDRKRSVGKKRKQTSRWSPSPLQELSRTYSLPFSSE